MKICSVCKTEYPDDCNFCEKDGTPLKDKDGKNCPHCGAQLKGKGKFCPECGKPTEIVEEKSEEKGCKCPKCGFESNEKLKFCPNCGYSFAEGGNSKKSGMSEKLVLIDGRKMSPFYISKYEVTQELYQSVTGENPSNFKGHQRPVENVSWYDAIRFCNLLSKKDGKTPVYSVNGNTDVDSWNYTAHIGQSINGGVKKDVKANGYRLPTAKEWKFAAAGGKNYTYAGSNNIDEVAWYNGNSGGETHEVGQKNANGYGLYDMSGNVWEWCWDSDDNGGRCNCGGSWNYGADFCEVEFEGYYYPYSRFNSLGFRVACNK